jgi:hypothetical protein
MPGRGQPSSDPEGPRRTRGCFGDPGGAAVVATCTHGLSACPAMKFRAEHAEIVPSCDDARRAAATRLTSKSIVQVSLHHLAPAHHGSDHNGFRGIDRGPSTPREAAVEEQREGRADAGHRWRAPAYNAEGLTGRPSVHAPESPPDNRLKPRDPVAISAVSRPAMTDAEGTGVWITGAVRHPWSHAARERP